MRSPTRSRRARLGASRARSDLSLAGEGSYNASILSRAGSRPRGALRGAASLGRRLRALGLAAILALAAGAEADDKAAPTAPAAAAPASSAAIPVAEVATRAAEVSTQLRRLTDPLKPSAEIDAIRVSTPGLHERVERDVEAAARILGDQPSLDVLQAQLQRWQQRQLVTAAWLNVLTERATLLQHALNRLADLGSTWSQTKDAAQKASAPAPILLQIDGALAAIDAAKAPLETQRDAVLDLQSAVAQEVARTESTLAQLVQAQERAVGGLFQRDRPPIWNLAAWRQARDSFPERIQEIGADHWAGITRYLQDPEGLRRHAVLLALLVVVLLIGRRWVRRLETTGEGPSPALRVFEYPISATIAVVLLVASSPWSPLPVAARIVVVVAGLGPVIRLTRRAADPRLGPEFFVLWGLFALASLRATIAGLPIVEQTLLIVEMVAGIGLITRSLQRGSLRLLPTRGPQSDRLATYRTFAGLVVLTFVVALGASTLGYLRLGRLLASGVLGSGALALILYANALVAAGLAAFALRVWPLSLLQMVQHHRDLLERRATRILALMAVIGWVARTLDFVGLFQPAWATVHAILEAEIGRGAIRIPVGSILEFFVTVWVAYLASTFIRFALREDVYPRAHVTRGISYAISSLLNYVIIALGFVLALGALGVDLTKVTVLAGALGVGIGFGLQGVVNNFVSGLILLFERPIHVGDIVEIGDLAGEVSRIGIRASTVRTWQGAEIIVPNAQLVTERVTNWTLSDRTRRIDVPVGVDYGSAPAKVVEVLLAVARAHPQVMRTPAPQAVFTSFGDSAINFELRAWTNRFEQWPVIRTELAAAIYTAVREAGMSLPFPQREVRVLRDAAPESDGSRRGPTIDTDSARPSSD